jgi:hypothetical protein
MSVRVRSWNITRSRPFFSGIGYEMFGPIGNECLIPGAGIVSSTGSSLEVSIGLPIFIVIMHSQPSITM